MNSDPSWASLPDLSFMIGAPAGVLAIILNNLGYRDIDTKNPTIEAIEEGLAQKTPSQSFVWHIGKVVEKLQSHEQFAKFKVLPEKEREGMQCVQQILIALREEHFAPDRVYQSIINLFSNAIGELENQQKIKNANVVLNYLEQHDFQKAFPKIYEKMRSMAPQHLLDRQELDEETERNQGASSVHRL